MCRGSACRAVDRGLGLGCGAGFLDIHRTGGREPGELGCGERHRGQRRRRGQRGRGELVRGSLGGHSLGVHASRGNVERIGDVDGVVHGDVGRLVLRRFLERLGVGCLVQGVRVGVDVLDLGVERGCLDLGLRLGDCRARLST